jgi:hypothetical protein
MGREESSAISNWLTPLLRAVSRCRALRVACCGCMVACKGSPQTRLAIELSRLSSPRNYPGHPSNTFNVYGDRRSNRSIEGWIDMISIERCFQSIDIDRLTGPIDTIEIEIESINRIDQIDRSIDSEA